MPRTGRVAAIMASGRHIGSAPPSGDAVGIGASFVPSHRVSAPTTAASTQVTRARRTSAKALKDTALTPTGRSSRPARG